MTVIEYQDDPNIAPGPSPIDVERWATSSAEIAVVTALRGGSEAAFATLIGRYHGSMLRVAGLYVADRAAAEDVVQETWMAVVRGIDRFDGRSSIKTWIFRILTNRAKTMGQRAAKVIPISSIIGGSQPEGRVLDAAHFFDAGHPYRRAHRCAPPMAWAQGPEDCATTREAVDVAIQAIATLPPAQRKVMTMRDVACWTAQEVCVALGISESNQRVLLHRARSKVRRRLEQHDASARTRRA